MISTIFGKTKPVNFIIVFAFLFVLYLIAHVVHLQSDVSLYLILSKLVLILVLFASVFVGDLIVKRNKLTAANSFTILFYGLLVAVFVESLLDAKAIICSFFLLLATQRIISMRLSKTLRSKIFDATLAILVASLCYDWALLYMLLVYAAVLIYDAKNLRNWFVPLVGFFTFFMVLLSILIVIGETDFLKSHYQFKISFNTPYFSSWTVALKLGIYVLIGLFLGIFSFLRLGKAGLGQLTTYRLLGFSFLIGLCIHLISVSAIKQPIMLTFFPVAVFISNYVDALKKANIKEIFLISSILLAFLLFVFGVVLK